MRNVVYLLLISSIPAFAQKIKSLEVSDTIVSAMVDRPGDLYVITRSGQIQKFDENGNLILVYKDKQKPTLFDPRDGARLFAYYRDTQQYEHLNPSFEVTSSYYIDSAFVIQPWLMCPAGDTKLWVLDAADHSLKKINPRESEVEVEVVVDSTLIKDATVFSTMREYQGFLFLLDPLRGIFIFNNLGKHIKTIQAKGITSFNFLGEELYYLKDNTVKLFDLFSAESRAIDVVGKANIVIITDRRLFSIGWKTIEISEFAP